MPVKGRLTPWIFKKLPVLAGGMPPGLAVYDLSDDVKLWAMITNGQISYSDIALVGLQASFEI